MISAGTLSARDGRKAKRQAVTYIYTVSEKNIPHLIAKTLTHVNGF